MRRPLETRAQLLSAPDDLAVRQVHADQLIEAGDPRGAFIAHQLELERLDLVDPRAAPLLASVRRLELKHRAAWLRPVLQVLELGPADLPSLAPVFRGGFLHSLRLPVELLHHFPTLATHEPLAGVELPLHEALPPDFYELDAAHAFRAFTLLPEGWFTTHSVGRLLAWGLPALRELDLSGADLSSQGGALLANAPTSFASAFEAYVDPPPFAPGQLLRLRLAGCQLGDVGVRTLLAAPHLTALRELDLSGNRLTDVETLRAMTRAPSLHHLTQLGLATTPAPLDALAGWPVLAQLTALSLPQTVDGATLRRLFPTPSPVLRTLDARSAKTLLETPAALFDTSTAFASLHVGTTSLGDDTWRALLNAPSMQPLLHLQANGCSLSDDAVEALCTSPLTRLVTLDLSSNKLTDAALARLMDWPGAALLTQLRLSNNRKLTRAGYDALIHAQAFEPTSLDVGKVKDAGALAALKERFGAALIS